MALHERVAIRVERTHLAGGQRREDGAARRGEVVILGAAAQLRDFPLRRDPALVLETMPTREGGRQGIERGLAMPRPPTAFTCYNDIVAMGAGHNGLVAAAYLAKAGKKVLLLVDSLSRVAMAQREIGLSAGEPPLPPNTRIRRPRGVGGKVCVGAIFDRFSISPAD